MSQEAKVIVPGNRYALRRLDTVVDGIATTLLTMTLGDDLIGSVELSQVSVKSASFRRLFVEPTSRRLNVGRGLVNRCVEIAFNEFKVETVGISVADDSGLIAFYRACGFILAYQYDDGSLLMFKTQITTGTDLAAKVLKYLGETDEDPEAFMVFVEDKSTMTDLRECAKQVRANVRPIPMTLHCPKCGLANPVQPIPMILHCPKCGLQHIDKPEPDKGWDNPPHRSHLCAGCAAVWRPAEVPTTGVAAMVTRGARDNWPPRES
jgi:predicted Zn-ribbon and HTH transcriptional regulator